MIFTLDAPRVTAEAVRAASDEGDDEGKLFADDRAVFTAVLDARHATAPVRRSSWRSTPSGCISSIRRRVSRSTARHARASRPLRDAEQRGLDVPEPVDVAAHPCGGVVEQERLGEPDDRIGERPGSTGGSYAPRRTSVSIRRVMLPTMRRWGMPSMVRMRSAASRSCSTKRSSAGASTSFRLRRSKVSRRAAPPVALRLGARLVEQRLPCVREHLPDQPLA